MFVASLTQRLSFRPCQGTLQRPFCFANSLSIALKVPFANKMTAISPFLLDKLFSFEVDRLRYFSLLNWLERIQEICSSKVERLHMRGPLYC